MSNGYTVLHYMSAIVSWTVLSQFPQSLNMYDNMYDDKYFQFLLLKILFYRTETPFYDRPPILVHLFSIKNIVQEVKASIQLKSYEKLPFLFNGRCKT